MACFILQMNEQAKKTSVRIQHFEVLYITSRKLKSNSGLKGSHSVILGVKWVISENHLVLGFLPTFLKGKKAIRKASHFAHSHKVTGGVQ